MATVKDFTNSLILRCNEFKAILNLDNFGIVASSLCLVHCLVLPFVLLFLPFLGLQFLASNLAHKYLAFFVFLFALTAIVPGYLQHKNQYILYAMIFGLSLVLFASFATNNIMNDSYEVPLITIGNLVLVATHLKNRKLCAQLHNLNCHNHDHY